jgi:uncharacterized protein (DUF362 family)
MAKKSQPAKQHTDTNNAGKEWTRRDLLWRGGQTVLLAGAAAGLGAYLYDPTGKAGLKRPEPIQLKDYFAPVEFPADRPRISVAYGSDEKTERMVQAAIGGLHPDGIKKFVQRGEVVMIKPNVGFDRDPRLGATTNPEIVATLVRLCFDAGASQVIVADNPIESPAACFAKSGIGPAAEKAGARTILHASRHDVPVAVRKEKPDPDQHEALGTWPIFWKPLQDADKVIGVAPVKDHNLCYASMQMKNWYGLLSGRRNQFHQAIHDIISDLGFMMKPTMVVADGTRVMMKNGPTGGRLEDVSPGGVLGRPVVAAGVDQVALDSWSFQKLLGRDPAKLAYLELAYKKFGNDPSRLTAPSWQVYREQGKIVEQTV